ncbi:MAG: methyltransferase domain-containing protein [Stenotrophomonas sp.]|uniref:methyltransferase domain-containing protein n=1 Tax=Stenotrophomonas sp. TaxID=69392 RepID=UPI003D6D5832
MTADEARAIAGAFAPTRPWKNWNDYCYALLKLRSDPLYPGVLAALRGSTSPVLDLGCGLGLLAHALRQDGQAMAYYGVDNDAAKIRSGRHAAGRAGLADMCFEQVDLATTLPRHQGSVAILDVLQYLQAEAQLALLQNTAAMLGDGDRLVIRMTVADGSRRSVVSRIGDRAANVVGWMRFRPRHYLGLDAISPHLQQCGLTVTATPLYGNTPFNNWLLVAQRD